MFNVRFNGLILFYFYKMIGNYVFFIFVSFCFSWFGCFFVNKRMIFGVLKVLFIVVWIVY